MLQNLGKYVIIINKERHGYFRIYHFDYRGSTVAITNAWGCIEATFEYDTYGKETKSEGDTSNVIFRFNGRDGVITDIHNGLLYMRARYYSPELRRFVNADIIPGEISNAVTLNRYAYANGNPVSNVDPFGLSAERGGDTKDDSAFQKRTDIIGFDVEQFMSDLDDITTLDVATTLMINNDGLDFIYNSFKDVVNTSKRPRGMGKREWLRLVKDANKQLDDFYGPTSKLAKGLKALPYISVGVDALVGGVHNYQNGEEFDEIITDGIIDVAIGVGSIALSDCITTYTVTKITGAIGTAITPGLGTAIGIGVGLIVSGGIYLATEVIEINGTSFIEYVDEKINDIWDSVCSWFN